MSTIETIDRDVGEQSKGPRLQKLRAIARLLEAVAISDDAHAYCAVEFEGDVYTSTATVDGTDEYREEDKNFDSDTTFTLVSGQVTNTLVIFIDCWVKHLFNEKLLFGFYTPNSFGKEKKTARMRALGIAWPDDPVLQYLTTPGELAKALPFVRLVALDAYRTQYDKPNSPGHIGLLEAWGDAEWLTFLGQISWAFGQPDEVQLELHLISKIKSCSHYNSSLYGKEQLIIAHLIDMLDKRQRMKSPIDRCIHASQLIVAFLQIGSGKLARIDPTWQILEQQTPSDTRSLREKVNAVITAPQSDLARWSRAAGSSHAEQQELLNDKSILSLKYQVWDACEPALADLRRNHAGHPLTPAIIDGWIGRLVYIAEARITDRSADYTYTLSNSDALRCMIWELIDSCYLAFDTGDINV